jgi:hypothetical protein
MGWSGRAPAPPAIEAGKGFQGQGACHSEQLNTTIAVMNVDIGKNSLHIVGLVDRGAATVPLITALASAVFGVVPCLPRRIVIADPH